MYKLSIIIRNKLLFVKERRHNTNVLNKKLSNLKKHSKKNFIMKSYLVYPALVCSYNFFRC